MNIMNPDVLSIGQLKLDTDKRSDRLAEKTILFISQQLPNWRDDKNRPDELSENKLNLQLCKFLNVHARHCFPMIRFDHEEYQTGRRSVDLSASPVPSVPT